MPRNTYVTTLKSTKGRSEQLARQILEGDKYKEFKSNFGEKFWKKGNGFLSQAHCLKLTFDHSETLTIQAWLRGGSQAYGFKEIDLSGIAFGSKKHCLETIAKIFEAVSSDPELLANPLEWVKSHTEKIPKK